MIRNNGCGIQAYQAAVGGLVVVHAGGTHDLRDDNALSAVYDKRTAGGHEREISHEYLLLLDLLSLKVAQTHADLERRGIRRVTGLALLLGVLGLLVHGIVDEAQLKITGIVGNGVGIPEHLAQAGLQKPLIALFLDLQQVGHVLDLFVSRKALSESFAVENIFRHWHTLLNRNRERPGQLLFLSAPVLYLRRVNGIL